MTAVQDDSKSKENGILQMKSTGVSLKGISLADLCQILSNLRSAFSPPPPHFQREVVSSTRLAAIPPAFGVRTLPAQATEYTFAYIQVPEDVSAPASTWPPPHFHKKRLSFTDRSETSLTGGGGGFQSQRW